MAFTLLLKYVGIQKCLFVRGDLKDTNRERERPKVQVREENLILFIYVLESELSKLLLKACH